MFSVSVRDIRFLVREGLITEAPAVEASDAMELMKKFPKGMKSHGINVEALKPIATGTRGTAFLSGDKVLKVTNDEKEAATAALLVGKELKNIVRFYSVWRFGDTPFYGILQEKLEELPKDKADSFNRALVATGLPIWIKRAEGSWDKAKSLTKQHIVSQVKKKFHENLNSPEAQDFVKKMNDAWNMLVHDFGLKEMFQTLTDMGIDFHDYHSGNLMMRKDGTLVLIDLGMSNIRGNPGKIETINELRKRILGS